MQYNPNEDSKKLFYRFPWNDSEVYKERQKTILEENKLGKWILPNFKIVVTQTVWYQENRQINGTECRPQKHTYMNVIYFYLVNFYRGVGEGNGNPLQYSCLQNPMDRGAWKAAFHGVAKSQTWLSIHAWRKIKWTQNTDSLSNKWCWNKWTSTCREINLNT